MVGEAIEPGELFAAESADAGGGGAEAGQEAVEPFGADAAVVEEFFLADVEGVFELDKAVFEEPDVEVDVVFDGAEAVVAEEDEGGVGGEGVGDLADAVVESAPEVEEAVADGGKVGAVEAVVGLPGVPEFVLDAVDGHEVVDEEVPGAGLSQEELDGFQMMVEEAGERREGLGFAAAVVDGGVPGLIGLAKVGFEAAEQAGVRGEVGGVLGGEEVAKKSAGEGLGAWRVAHGDGAGDGAEAMAGRDFPDQVGVDRT